MTAANTSRYQVILEGRRVGPYDQRTIVGMRIKQTLSSDHVLVDGNGIELTVGDLLGRQRGGSSRFNASQSGVYFPLLHTYSASLAGVAGRGLPIPSFRGEMEVRLQSDVLRLSGRFRRFMSWRDTRIKIPLSLIMQAQAHGSRLDLWLRASVDAAIPQDVPLQRLSLDLFSKESVGELLAALPAVPETNLPSAQSARQGANRSLLTWVAVIAVMAIIGVVSLMLMFRRIV